MDIVVLTAVCVGGMALAVFFVVRWGGHRRLPAPLVVPGSPGRFSWTLRRMLRGLSMVFLAGGLAGILTAGLGGRLMMRVIAATSGDDAQNRITEADEVVGEITLGGSIGLVVFVGLFGGLLGGAAYLVLRRWLPGSARTAGLVLGALALGMAPGIEALDPDSVDFELLRPDGLAVAMLVAVFLLFGMTVASVIEWADRFWPLLEWRPLAVAAHLPVLLLLPLGLPMAVFIALLLLVLLAQHVEPLARFVRGRGVDVGGRALVAVAGVAALAWCGANVFEILDGRESVAALLG